MKCGENVSFMPQKDSFIFILTEYYIKCGFEGKLTSHTSQNGGWHCFGRHFSHFQ